MAWTMTNVLHIMQSLLGTAIRSTYPSFTQLKGIVQSSGGGGRFGDYKCMAAMPIAKVCVYSLHITVCTYSILGSYDCPFFLTLYCTMYVFMTTYVASVVLEVSRRECGTARCS